MDGTMPQQSRELPSYLRGMKFARPTLAFAEEYCRRITKSHYENFPVASVFIPKGLRQHIYNIYAFARTADDFADEVSFTGDRMAALNEWEEELHLAYEGQSVHPIFVALETTISRFHLPKQLFLDLLKAFKMDVVTDKYKNFVEVLYYCRHSANPVGRLILLLFGYNNEEWFSWSDNICTALQLANFWQDVSVDLKKNEKGRIYIPQDEMASAGVNGYDLESGRPTEKLTKLMKMQVERTEKFFVAGRPLCRAVPSMLLSYELRLTWLGGMEILQKIKENGFDPFKRPVIGKIDLIKLGFKAILF